MDFLDELEAMAQAASAPQNNDDILESTISQWQKLFNYSAAAAENKITAHRKDLARFTVSDNHWSIVRERKEAEGHDRESYEHLCGLISRDKVNQHPEITLKERRRLRASNFLIKLEGPLNSVQAIVQAAGLSSV